MTEDDKKLFEELADMQMRQLTEEERKIAFVWYMRGVDDGMYCVAERIKDELKDYDYGTGTEQQPS